MPISKSGILCLTVFALLGGCRGAPDQTAPEAPRLHPGWQSAYVTCNGIRLHYWRTGGAGKPVLVLAHGITDYGLNWASLAERLEGDYDLVMYDARGHGYSDKPDGPYALATHVADLVGLVGALGIEKPVLMGHSMGGATVALAAATHPDLARAVILEDPADMLARLQPLGESIIPDWKKQIRADRRADMAKLMVLARTRRHPGWRDRDYELWAESKLLVNPNVVDILRGDGFGDAGVTYPRLLVPTLILKADADAESRKRHLEIASLLPKGRLVHIDGAGHVIRNDRPEETEREIRTFLSGL
jgi:pimeloyl-ACP methyl ester carboxylesterase